MASFDFSTNVIQNVIHELESAEEYIKMAVFQLHNQDIFNLLFAKLEQGVDVDIFTLPPDSINDNIREEISPRFDELERCGASLHFCKWNVGDPGRTTTASGRWYSFHGKFIVTDKSAISLTANFTLNNELDALLIFDEHEKINQFNETFDRLIDLFITPHNGFDGSIHEKIIAIDSSYADELFNVPNTIENTNHINHWIVDYPSSLCAADIELEDQLYIVPFDGKGRDLIESIINEASDFVYITAESFTDPDFPLFIRKSVANKNLDFKILCGSKSRDFTDRVNTLFRELLSLGIDIKTQDDIHSKLVITDKHLVVSSINLNKMNLGFWSKKDKLWRENTESLLICSDSTIINSAKNQYLLKFDDCIDIKIKLAEKIEKDVTQMFNGTFGLRTKLEAKQVLSKHILEMEVEIKKITFKVGMVASKMMTSYQRKTISKDDIISALILYYLSEGKLNLILLTDKLKGLDETIDIIPVLTKLVDNNLVEIEEDFYKINVETLF